MSIRDVTLHDKFDLAQNRVLMNGTQALVRLMLMQKARDEAAGLNTAGYVTGYRGSPLGAVDLQMNAAAKDLAKADVIFQPGLNEDLAATAIWGTQQAELRGEGTKDGVFALWYGKGPGVDRSGDVMRHANMAGTSPNGGVVMALGDDHTGESSTVCHQSDWALVDAYMPVLSPAGVQEILDYGLYGYALSRFAGVWAGLKVMKDTVEVTSVVDAGLNRHSFVTPEIDMPEGGLNIRLGDHWIEQEARITDHKRFAAEAFSHANKMDNRIWGKPGAKIGFVAAGKNWLDLVHALGLLGIDEAEADRLGLTTYKVGQTFPLDMKGFRDWAEGLDLIVVVEEKRKLLEVQIKEVIFDDRRGRRVYGWRKGHPGAEELFPVRYALDPAMIAEKIGDILIEESRGTDAVKAGLQKVRAAQVGDNAPDIATRLPYFCSGCPHNTSTKLEDGARGYAGIGCHFMVQWMDRETTGFTHMGAEGANWIGEAPFSTRDHVFQNLGDGTYNHSGILAVRAAIASGVNITYKLLYNDAVAMTGGQANDGDLPPERIVRELLAAGVTSVDVVFDPKEEPKRGDFPAHIGWHERDQMPDVQSRLAKVKGVTAIVFIQTCAAEKRRRRKRGTFPDIDKRVFINTDICEGCGDCGVQSNCVSIVPVETELGRKRAIDQSSCNKDFSCLKGFCPSFVTVEGAELKKQASIELDTGSLPYPEVPKITGTHNIVITGVGGTGVVTIGALLAMAAHLDGKGAGVMEMAGLAQKGGAVHIHCRIGNAPEDISAIRVAVGEADTLIGGDLVVSAGSKTTQLMTVGQTKGVVNTHEIITGDFTRNPDFRVPGDQLRLSLEAKMGDGLVAFDAYVLAEAALGDAIYSNMILLGAAWQMGQVPLSLPALMRAIELNGAKITENTRAFEIGRWAVLNPDNVAEITTDKVVALPRTLEEKIAFRADHLTAYQSRRLAKKYRNFVDKIDDATLKELVAKSYHKLLAYKDEFEVARLLKTSRDKAEAAFDGDLKLTFHLAPPGLGGKDSIGRPKKRDYGQMMERLFPLLARMKRLRGTPFNPFGYTSERKMERGLIKTYRRDMTEVLRNPGRNMEAALALAEWPMEVRGFGPVKEANAKKALARRDTLLEAFRGGEKDPVLEAAE
ncbi:indolepyruvate ferredoxin oxidoreductase family protein [Rhodobacteraceae bacterium]|nr:indolepyruvate ferredoxin oxidoreductase family protein [Paracoccaceae bacterium]